MSDPLALTLTSTLASQVPAAKVDTEAGSRLDLTKVLNLFLNKHTCKLSSRQCGAIRRVCRHNGDGFLLDDLPHINRIMTLLSDRLESEACFVRPLCALLQLCGVPFQAAKSNDLFRNADTVCDTLVVIGSILNGAHGSVRELDVYKVHIARFIEDGALVQVCDGACDPE